MSEEICEWQFRIEMLHWDIFIIIYAIRKEWVKLFFIIWRHGLHTKYTHWQSPNVHKIWQTGSSIKSYHEYLWKNSFLSLNRNQKGDTRTNIQWCLFIFFFKNIKLMGVFFYERKFYFGIITFFLKIIHNPQNLKSPC